MPVNLAGIATINRKPLYQGQPGTSVATVYTVPASTDVAIKSIVLCNTSGSSATVTISVVPSGGTAGVANRIVAGLSVAAGETVAINAPTYMTTGDFLAAFQGTSGAITATINGETYA